MVLNKKSKGTKLEPKKQIFKMMPSSFVLNSVHGISPLAEKDIE